MGEKDLVMDEQAQQILRKLPQFLTAINRGRITPEHLQNLIQGRAVKPTSLIDLVRACKNFPGAVKELANEMPTWQFLSEWDRLYPENKEILSPIAEIIWKNEDRRILEPGFTTPTKSIKLKRPDEQIGIFHKHFPELRGGGLLPTPEVAKKFWERVNPDGWLAIPSIERMVAAYKDEYRACGAQSYYNFALIKLLQVLKNQNSRFKNYLDLKEAFYRKVGKTQHLLNGFGGICDNNSDYSIFPVQVFSKHACRSPRRARVLFGVDEFGLTPYEIASLLITHPEILTTIKKRSCLRLYCTGMIYDAEESGNFTEVPYFYYFRPEESRSHAIFNLECIRKVSQIELRHCWNPSGFKAK